MVSLTHSNGSIDQFDFSKKPEVIHHFNETKGSISIVDRKNGNYSVKYKFKKWHVVLFCNVLDIACHNLFVLSSEVLSNYESNNCHKKKKF